MSANATRTAVRNRSELNQIETKRSFVRSFRSSFVRSKVRSFVRSKVRSFVPKFVCSFRSSFVRSFEFRSFVRSKVRSFVPKLRCSFRSSEVPKSRSSAVPKFQSSFVCSEVPKFRSSAVSKFRSSFACSFRGLFVRSEGSSVVPNCSDSRWRKSRTAKVVWHSARACGNMMSSEGGRVTDRQANGLALLRKAREKMDARVSEVAMRRRGSNFDCYVCVFHDCLFRRGCSHPRCCGTAAANERTQFFDWRQQSL